MKKAYKTPFVRVVILPRVDVVCGSVAIGYSRSSGNTDNSQKAAGRGYWDDEDE